jgi:hypothetical protein
VTAGAPSPSQGRRSGRGFLAAAFGFGCGCAFLIASPFILFVVASLFGLPDALLTDSQLSESQRAELVAAGVLEEGEEVVFLYADGIWDLLENGAVLTDRRVISYTGGDGAAESQAVRFAAIRRIDPLYAEGWGENSLIEVEGEDGESIFLLVTNTDHADHRFYERLQREWKAHAPEAAAAADAPAERGATGGVGR